MINKDSMGCIQDWQSYNSVAEAYEEIATSQLFKQPAKDLVTDLRIPSGALVLDVGTGTGVGALQALTVYGLKLKVFGIDPSLAMLHQARRNGLSLLVAGEAPVLPYVKETFDFILANFVITHFSDYETSLLDIARVMRHGGKIAMTTWKIAKDNKYSKVWQEIAESYISTLFLRKHRHF
jgi:ubiquinone/menaquinone biosynthesis C-methylase UbiE